MILLQFACQVLERLIKQGWEVIASPVVTTTPGFEFCSWIFRKSKTPPLHNAQVASLVISKSKVSVVGNNKQVQINNAVRGAIKKCVEDKQASISPIKRCTPASEDVDDQMEDLRENSKTPVLPESSKQTIGRLFGAKATYKDVKDDPDCPEEFEAPGGNGGFESSNFILEVVHILFCRQWKLIADAVLPKTDCQQVEAYFFCRDGRILPSLGQQTFAMLEFEQPNILRLFNGSPEVDKCLRSVLKGSKETRPFHNVIEYSCKSDYFNNGPWQSGYEESESDAVNSTERAIIEERRQVGVAKSHELIGNILLAVNKQGLNLYARTTAHHTKPKTQFIFKQSNVSYSEALCIHLSGKKH